jgi:two-component system cell cycle sensor histidine kinase/response regulator CckA
MFAIEHFLMSDSKQGRLTSGVLPSVAAVNSQEQQCSTEADALFRILFIDNPLPMWLHDTTTLKFIEVNSAAVEHYGYSRDEFLRMLLTDILFPENGAHLREKNSKASRAPQHSTYQRHLLKNGRLIVVDIESYKLAFAGHEAELTTVRENTKQNHAEQGLRNAERKYRLMFDEAIIGIYQSSPSGRLLSANPAMARMFGFDSAGEMVACINGVQAQPQLYVDPTLWDEFKRLMREKGVVRHFEMQAYRKDSSKMWLCTNSRAVRHGDTIVRYEGTFEDITDRKVLEDQLRRAQQKYQDIVENAIVGIFQSTLEGRYLSVNPAMSSMLGYDSPQELMASITDSSKQIYVEPRCRDDFKRLVVEQSVVKNFECQVYRKDGSKMWVSMNVRALSNNGVLVGYEGMNEDVTQRKLLEEQLRQAQKMEAVGQLAGGVAHDFNNSLSVIIGYSDLLQMNLPAQDTAHEYALEIAKAGRRAAGLTRQLLAFSRKQVIRPVVLDLNTATSELENILCRLIGENIEVTFKRTPGLGRVKMDPGQVEQVLMNLAANSRDAMPQGGKLCIETANVELDEAYARQNLYVKPGSYVMLSVSDTGCGMDAETQRHVFEPFFTTKEAGKGTGLGLATVYGIAKQNAGYVMVGSELGRGTTFKVYLPRLSDGAKLFPRFQTPQNIPRGTETILVVEDEEALRILARTCLESNHYSVLDAPNAAAALDLAKNHHGRIHLLLTDVVMPGMSGRELAKRLTAFQPQVKVLYMSGYTDNLVNQQGILNRDTLLLEKPFTLHSLLGNVYRAMHTIKRGKATPAN